MNKFYIPFTLPSLNEYIEMNRKNRYAAASMKRRVQDDIDYVIMSNHLPKISSPVEVHLVWVEPNNKRDIDNIQFGTKFILDSLVEMGVLENDTRKWVAQVQHFVRTANKNETPGVEVCLVTKKN